MGIDRKINEDHSMTIGIGANIRRRLFVKNNGFIPSDDEVTRIINAINKQLDTSYNNDLSNNLYKIDYSSLNDMLSKMPSEQTLFSTYSSLIRRYIYHVIAEKGRYDFQNGKHVELDEYINGLSSTYAKYYPDHPELSFEEGLSSVFFDIFKDYTKKNGFGGKKFDKRSIKKQLFGLYTIDDQIVENTNYMKKVSDVFFHTFLTKTAFLLNINEYNLYYFLNNIFPDSIPLKLEEFIASELIKEGIDCKLAYDIISDLSSEKKTINTITDQIVFEIKNGKSSINPKILFGELMRRIEFDSKTGLSSPSIYKRYYLLIESTMNNHYIVYSKLKSLCLKNGSIDVLVLNNEYNDNIGADEIDVRFADKLNDKYNDYIGYLQSYDGYYFKNRLEKSFSFVIEHGIYIKRKDIILYNFLKYSIAIDMQMISINSESSKYIKVQLEGQELYVRYYKGRFINNTNDELDKLGYPPLSFKRQFDLIVLLSVLYESPDPKLKDKKEEETPIDFFFKQINKYKLL